MTHVTLAHDPCADGLQAERTTLAWTRTSFAFLANGALLMLKDFHGSNGLAALIPAGLAAAVAVSTFLIALQRQRTLARRPLPTRVTPRCPVYLVGVAVVLLIVATEWVQPVFGRIP